MTYVNIFGTLRARLGQVVKIHFTLYLYFYPTLRPPIRNIFKNYLHISLFCVSSAP